MTRVVFPITYAGGGAVPNATLVMPSRKITGGPVMTRAEQDSIRVYAHYPQSNPEWVEVARDVSILGQVWIAAPLLSQGSEYLFDFDGQRPDYPPSNYYGAESAWSVYQLVYHLDPANIVDRSRYSHNVVADTSTRTFGRIGKARYFDGTSSYIKIAANTNTIPVEFTIAFWLRMQSRTPPSYQFAFRGGSSGPNKVVIGNNSSSDLFSVSVSISNNTSPAVSVPSSQILDGANHYITATADGSALHLYIDGVAKGSTSYNGNVTIMSGASYLGVYDPNESSGNLLYPMKGKIDEFQIAYVAFDADKIALTYASQSSPYSFFGAGYAPVQKVQVDVLPTQATGSTVLSALRLRGIRPQPVTAVGAPNVFAIKPQTTGPVTAKASGASQPSILRRRAVGSVIGALGASQLHVGVRYGGVPLPTGAVGSASLMVGMRFAVSPQQQAVAHSQVSPALQRPLTIHSLAHGVVSPVGDVRRRGIDLVPVGAVSDESLSLAIRYQIHPEAMATGYVGISNVGPFWSKQPPEPGDPWDAAPPAASMWTPQPPDPSDPWHGL